MLPDRDSAEELATELVEEHGIAQEPQILREALAGEDDAEDAQWLVVLDSAASTIDVQALQELAHSYEGWLERD
ncbi:hypothetical protein MTQ01_07675 [Streptomyces sp. XM4193]|uniref:hypothetical protein n=1 Tax=Streptomyces sp. XM4193 TaxID=2929782 RepID=UPI001FF84F19|nr:hypothetical protein [Streptomyces sp. XM4193]MCK1795882.1 hypothetical protein [Streptomyces sp. XM4193]